MAPVKGLWAHAVGGLYHDARFAILQTVIDHYNTRFKLSLAEKGREDLAEHLKLLYGWR